MHAYTNIVFNGPVLFVCLCMIASALLNDADALYYYCECILSFSFFLFLFCFFFIFLLFASARFFSVETSLKLQHKVENCFSSHRNILRNLTQGHKVTPFWVENGTRRPYLSEKMWGGAVPYGYTAVIRCILWYGNTCDTVRYHTDMRIWAVVWYQTHGTLDDLERRNSPNRT